VNITWPSLTGVGGAGPAFALLGDRLNELKRTSIPATYCRFSSSSSARKRVPEICDRSGHNNPSFRKNDATEQTIECGEQHCLRRLQVIDSAASCQNHGGIRSASTQSIRRKSGTQVPCPMKQRSPESQQKLKTILVCKQTRSDERHSCFQHLLLKSAEIIGDRPAVHYGGETQQMRSNRSRPKL